MTASRLFPILSLAIFVFGGLVLPSCHSLYAATTVTSITGDTVWIADNNPYVVENDLYVAPDVTLTIREGVVVKFRDQSSLFVEGNLVIKGLSNNRTVFTSLANDSVLGDTNGDGNLSFPSTFDNWSIYVPGGNITIEHSDLIYGGGVIVLDSTATINDVSFTETQSGIEVYDATAHIEKTRFIDAWGPLILSMRSDIYVDDLTAHSPLSTFDLISLFNNTGQFKNININNSFSYTNFGIYSSSAYFENLTLSDGLGSAIEVYTYWDNSTPSFVEIKNSTITNFDGDRERAAISLYHDSEGSIENVKIKDSYIALSLYNNPHLIISNSSLSGNETGIESYSGAGTVDARSNWWGDGSGPFHATKNPQGLGDDIVELNDSIEFIPWLTTEPGTIMPSVAFIPGFQGTRLYIDRTFWGHDRVWEPETFFDPTALYLDQNGKSINTIMVGEAVDSLKASFFGLPLKSVYGGFFTFLDEQKTSGVIADWDTLPYDWRMAQDSIVTESFNLFGGGQYDMVSRIESLASTSPNGKVVIIGHSNGGLVGKLLIDELLKQGKEDLIDQFIMIGTPQLGTLKAVAGLLHGEDQQIFGGLIMKKDIARDLGRNMPGAYGLLPSEEYFNTISDPIITFDTSSTTARYRSTYGESVDTYDELQDFYVELEGRNSSNVLSEPISLNPSILNHSQGVQNYLDQWQAPTNIKVTQIVGWGLHTIKGIEYYERERLDCSNGLLFCTKERYLDYRPIFTTEGDGTVVYPSAGYLIYTPYYFHLPDESQEENKIGHLDLTESKNLQNQLNKLFENEPDLARNFYEDKPSPDPDETYIQLAVYSPVSVTVIDANGNRTGLLAGNNPHTDEMRAYVEEISGSSYYEFGEGKYILIPASGSYTLTLEGYGSGTATLEVSMLQEDRVIEKAVYSHFPVQNGSFGTLLLNEQSVDDFELSYDIEGDGVIDYIYKPGIILEAPGTEEVFDVTQKSTGTAMAPRATARVRGASIEPLEKRFYNILLQFTDILTDLMKEKEEDGILNTEARVRFQDALESLTLQLWQLTEKDY